MLSVDSKGNPGFNDRKMSYDPVREFLVVKRFNIGHLTLLYAEGCTLRQAQGQNESVEFWKEPISPCLGYCVNCKSSSGRLRAILSAMERSDAFVSLRHVDIEYPLPSRLLQSLLRQ